MRILLAAGGTAGHINPAMAIAQKMQKMCPGAEIHFAGRKNGMEHRMVQQAGYPFHEIEVRGIQRRLSVENVARNAAALYYLALSIPRARAILRSVQPDLVIGTGGYVSGPVLKAAARSGILTALHEQNAFPGITNRLLARTADAVFAAMPDAVDRLGAPQERVLVTGNPVRDEMRTVQRAQARRALGIEHHQVLLLSFGGSLGAQRLNEAVAQLAQWEKTQPQLVHLHATGSIERDDFAHMAQKCGLNDLDRFRICEYIDEMPTALAAADLVISRAGALTLAEIAAAGRASVLIPSPNVAENHQYYNALQFEQVGAARVIEEKDLTQQALTEIVRELVKDPAQLMEMGARARALDCPNALQSIADALLMLLKTGKPK